MMRARLSAKDVGLVSGVLWIVGCMAQSSEPDAAALTVAAEPRAEGVAGLGRIDFPNSGPAAAQAPFLRGVLLLHSFEYEDSAEAFREAESLAPDFALAYWGEALTYCHPIWQQENLEASRAALTKLAPTPAERAAKSGDERERELLGAAEILFGDGTRAERARAYCARLAELSTRWPDDLELAAFHALAILGTATQGRDVPTYMRAAAVAETVLARAPDHPGALHYAIHAFDDPTHACLGLPMARRYGVVAAAAEHALHMPSHIYVALGMWTDSVAANVAAAAAADARRERKHLDVEARGYHSLAWLAYSYLQLGNEAEAARLLADMVRDEGASHSKRTRGALVAMRAAQVVAQDSWDGPDASFEVVCDGLEPATAAAELYVRGRAALARGDVARAREALAAIEVQRGPLETLPQGGADAQCCAPAKRSDYLPGRLSAQVMEIELSALLAQQAGATDEALTRFARAAEKEDAMGYDFGPPSVVEPAHELFGYVCLAQGKTDEAAREFAKALERAPGRLRSQRGLAQARTRTSTP